MAANTHGATAIDKHRPLRWGAALALFHPQRIALGLALPDKQSALQEIGRLGQRRCGPGAAEIVRLLARREARGSTALGRGAALPHADVPRLRAPVAVYLQAESGVDFGASDGIPVSNILALLVPRPATAAHFELLSRLTQRFRHPALREDLSFCADLQQVCDVLSRWCDPASTDTRTWACLPSHHPSPRLREDSEVRRWSPSTVPSQPALVEHGQAMWMG
jgi:PTS system nitrogen regulatory IIA component